MSVWNEMKSVLFIAPKEWVSNPLELKMLLDQFFDKVEKREIILFADKKIKPEENENVKWITYFSKTDFNILGKPNNEKVKEVLKKTFDTLIVCGTLNKKMAKTILKSRFKQIIGLNSANDFIAINLQSKSNEPSEMVNFAKCTLSKIKNS